MNKWWQDFSRILKWILYFLVAIFTLFIVNQLMLTYQFFSQLLHPLMGMIVAGLLLFGLIYLGFKIYKTWGQQPEIVELADDASEAEFHIYLMKVKEILQDNPNLADFDFDQTEMPLSSVIDKAFIQLHERSLPLIKENANAIFLSTAISQNGALDSFVVLFSLLRMVWQLSNFYQTRPTLKGMVKLYIQVASVVLMARTIEDADLIEGQMEPLITSVIGESIASAIPGMVPITNLVVSSLMEGSINAFLTLRVGLIAQTYLGMDRNEEKNKIRRSASVNSISYMGEILSNNSKVVVKSIGSAVKNAGKGIIPKKWFFEK